jgi:hypothetical protein
MIYTLSHGIKSNKNKKMDGLNNVIVVPAHLSHGVAVNLL